MPKVVISDRKGLVQSAGSGLVLNSSLNLSSQALTVPAAAEASTLTASQMILPSTGVAILTRTSSANDRAYLPSPTAVPDGHVVVVTATDGCELSSRGDGTTATTINGTAVTAAGGAYAAELAIAANVTVWCVKTGANAWHCGTMTSGTPDS